MKVKLITHPSGDQLPLLVNEGVFSEAEISVYWSNKAGSLARLDTENSAADTQIHEERCYGVHEVLQLRKAAFSQWRPIAN